MTGPVGALVYLVAPWTVLSLLAFIADRLDERAWRRDVARAHARVRPFDRERDEAAA